MSAAVPIKQTICEARVGIEANVHKETGKLGGFLGSTIQVGDADPRNGVFTENILSEIVCLCRWRAKGTFPPYVGNTLMK